MDGESGPLLPQPWLEVLIGWSALLGLVVAAVVITVVLLRRNRRPAPPQLGPHGVPEFQPRTVEAQLIEIDELLAQGRISPEEHAAMRSRILDLR